MKRVDRYVVYREDNLSIVAQFTVPQGTKLTDESKISYTGQSYELSTLEAFEELVADHERDD